MSTFNKSYVQYPSIIFVYNIFLMGLIDKEWLYLLFWSRKYLNFEAGLGITIKSKEMVILFASTWQTLYIEVCQWITINFISIDKASLGELRLRSIQRWLTMYQSHFNSFPGSLEHHKRREKVLQYYPEEICLYNSQHGDSLRNSMQ